MSRSAANSTLYPACERQEERSFSEKSGQKLRSISSCLTMEEEEEEVEEDPRPVVDDFRCWLLLLPVLIEDLRRPAIVEVLAECSSCFEIG